MHFESLINTLDIALKYTCYKFFGTKKTEIHSFFLYELQLITVSLLIRDCYISCSARFVPLKVCGVFSIFDSISFLLKSIFLFNKKHRLFDFKTS